MTSTASGKTLAFNAAILDRLLRDPAGRVLYVYPLNALANDQATGLRALVAHLPGDARPRVGLLTGQSTVDEKREAWRKEFYELCMPVAQTCKTPGEAAQKLNGAVFRKLNLKFSTERKAPNQSPRESIEGGTASCTGLSIVLSDACRAVCVPARGTCSGSPNSRILWHGLKRSTTAIHKKASLIAIILSLLRRRLPTSRPSCSKCNIGYPD